jgi:hypothetical protein
MHIVGILYREQPADTKTRECFYNFVEYMLGVFFFFFLIEPHYVAQNGLELKIRNPPASNSQVLGLQLCTTIPS